MSKDEIMIPLATVTAIANYVLAHPRASVADVMAEFDLGPDEAILALVTARYAIIAIATEGDDNAD